MPDCRAKLVALCTCPLAGNTLRLAPVTMLLPCGWLMTVLKGVMLFMNWDHHKDKLLNQTLLCLD